MLVPPQYDLSSISLAIENTLSDLRKQNQRLKWLLNVVVDLNLKEEVRTDSFSPLDYVMEKSKDKNSVSGL